VVDGGRLTVGLRRGDRERRRREKFGRKMVWGRNGYRMDLIRFQNLIFDLFIYFFYFFFKYIKRQKALSM
jgi:hypothetical protein